MNEIKVYHAFSRNSIIAVSCFAVALACDMTVAILDSGTSITAWLSALFFAGFGLYLTYYPLKERITNTPFLVITEECVVMNSGERREIRFSDVEKFFFSDVVRKEMIGIRYKQDVELQKADNASKMGSGTQTKNEKLANIQEAIPANGLTIKPKELLDLLNERKENYSHTATKEDKYENRSYPPGDQAGVCL